MHRVCFQYLLHNWRNAKSTCCPGTVNRTKSRRQWWASISMRPPLNFLQSNYASRTISLHEHFRHPTDPMLWSTFQLMKRWAKPPSLWWEWCQPRSAFAKTLPLTMVSGNLKCVFQFSCGISHPASSPNNVPRLTPTPLFSCW